MIDKYNFLGLELKLAILELKNKKANRSGVSYLNHVIEGLHILDIIGADINTMKAFCLHPLVQNDEDLNRNINIFDYFSITPRVIGYVMEYRWVANTNLRHHVKCRDWVVTKSIIPEVNQMLIADKIQNRKDFRLYQSIQQKDTEELEKYFSVFLETLGISEEEYERIIGLLNDK